MPLNKRKIAQSLSRLRERLKNPKSLYAQAYSVIWVMVVNKVIRLLTFILVARSYPKSEYGLMSLCVAALAVFPTICNNLDDTLVRFLPTANREERAEIMGGQGFLKMLIVLGFTLLALLGSSLAEKWLRIAPEQLAAFHFIYWFAVFNIVAVSFEEWVYKVINAFMLYKPLLWFVTIGALLNFASAVFCIFANLQIGVYLALGSAAQIIAGVLGCTYFFKSEVDFKRVCQHFSPSNMKKIYREKIHSYNMPLVGVAATSYIKGRLPSVVLGATTSTEILANFSIVLEFYSMLHKGFANFGNRLYPTLFKRIDASGKIAEKDFKKGFFIAGGLRFVSALVCVLGSSLLFRIYKIEPTKEMFLVNRVLASEYLLLFFGTVGNFVILSSKSTKDLFFSALIRNVGFGFFAVYLTAEYGVVGTVAGLLLGSIVISCLLMNKSRSILQMKWPYHVCVFSCFLLGLWTLWSYVM